MNLQSPVPKWQLPRLELDKEPDDSSTHVIVESSDRRGSRKGHDPIGIAQVGESNSVTIYRLS